MKKTIELKPLFSSQLKELMDIKVGDKKTGKIMIDNKSIGLSTGMLYSGKFHFLYKEKSIIFFEKAIEFLEINNPDLKFYVKYT